MKKIYKLEITYTSGRSKEFWVESYELLDGGGISWVSHFSTFTPLWNNKDNVESIWAVEEQEVEDAVV